MACFVAPAGVAMVTTIVRKVVEKREKAAALAQMSAREETALGAQTTKTLGKWTQRLGWLNTMLWGGTVLLALEHVWHGEVVPWPPFFTAMETPGAVGPMLREIATYGATMTAVVVAVWGGMVGVAVLAERRAKASTRSDAEVGAAGGGA